MIKNLIPTDARCANQYFSTKNNQEHVYMEGEW